MEARFLVAVVRGSMQALRYPSVWLPAAAASIGLSLGHSALGGGAQFWDLPPNHLLALGALLAGWAWLGLMTSATTIAVLRAGGRWRPSVLVPAPRAFQVGVVYVAALVPVMAGLVFLVVPGVVLAIWWSQAGLLVLDGQAEWLDALGESRRLTSGRRLAVLFAWLAIALLLTAISYLAGAAAPAVRTDLVSVAARAAGQAVTDVIGLVTFAAVFVELDRTDPDALVVR